MPFKKVRYLLLQVRNPDDPMRGQEVGCFSRALRCDTDQIHVTSLLDGVPTRAQIDAVDMVLLGGSGDYSVAKGGPWLDEALEAMRELHEWSKPTFASCWGFQAMARAMGGEVVTDLDRAELGTLDVCLTEAGKVDPLFSPLGSTFSAPMGHQDIVDKLPEGALLLATNDRVTNQAFRFEDKPIYCTQFHPELNRQTLIERLVAYPWYVESIVGLSLESFSAQCRDTPHTQALLPRFVEHVFG